MPADYGSPQKSSTSPAVKATILILGLLGLLSCLCGLFVSLTPLLGIDAGDGTAITIGEGVLGGLLCIIPAVVLFAAAAGIWFFFGRD